MNIFKEIKWFLQRGGRGYADCDIWSLDLYLAKIISESIDSLRKNHSGYPTKCKTDGEWIDILDKISYAFKNYIDFEDDLVDDLKYIDEEDRCKGFTVESIKTARKREKEVTNNLNESLDLFKKYFRNLWD